MVYIVRRGIGLVVSLKHMRGIEGEVKEFGILAMRKVKNVVVSLGLIQSGGRTCFPSYTC